MSLTRLTPTLSPLFRMLAEDPLFTRLAAPVFGELASRPAMGMRVPALDVKEQGDKWVVEAEVPGVKGKGGSAVGRCESPVLT